MAGYSDGGAEQTNGDGVVPKTEMSDYDASSFGENVASSSGSNVRSSLVSMGFAPSLIDRVIEENGEDNIDLLLETLFTYSALQKPKTEPSDSLDGLFGDRNELAAGYGAGKAPHRSESSDSLDGLFDDDEETCVPSNRNRVPLKEEHSDLCIGVNEKKASLIRMNFSVDEVEFAMEKLGQSAPIVEIVDFILAAQLVANDPAPRDSDKDQGVSTEALFGTMDKTLVLLEMGFSEQEVSTAFEICGTEAPISELAASIVSEQETGTCTNSHKYHPISSSRNSSIAGDDHSIDPLIVKAEEYGLEDISIANSDLLENLKGKRPKEQFVDERGNLKRPKQECYEDLSSCLGSAWSEARHRNSLAIASLKIGGPPKKVHRRAEQLNTYQEPNFPIPNSCRAVDEMAIPPPYFFYGNIMRLSHVSWVKISQFLYVTRPEFVNTQAFSALNRPEGYVYNLPTENRFNILPKPSMTIEDAIPRSRKWWPSWDTRKQLNCINYETSGIVQICERLGQILYDTNGCLSVNQQQDFLHQCQMLNLVWVGRFELAPIEPEHLEGILGYPAHHTRAAGFTLEERLLSLKNCYQVDTLAYHLSVLKSSFPGGLTVLSVFSGIGGAEIALHRLGIKMKVVVSVEPCETKRRILKRWWENQGISAELVQLENIQRLANDKLEGLIDKYGGFDFVICQNPCPSLSAVSKSTAGFDFQLFYEFVRVLQCVRSSMKKDR